MTTILFRSRIVRRIVRVPVWSAMVALPSLSSAQELG
jgi:hypothetical protein